MLLCLHILCHCSCTGQMVVQVKLSSIVDEPVEPVGIGSSVFLTTRSSFECLTSSGAGGI